MRVKLEMPVRFLKGVGPHRARMLEKAGIHCVEDLLKYAPFRYEDRANFRQIRELVADEEAVIRATVEVTGRYTTPFKKVRIFEMVVKDESGLLPVKFFHQPYLDRVFRKGRQVILFGAPRHDSYAHSLALINPEYEIIDSDSDTAIHMGRIVPIYRRIGPFASKTVRQLIFQSLEVLGDDAPDALPPILLSKYGFPDRRAALEQLHFPPPVPPEQVPAFLAKLESRQTPAQQRLIFEEFFAFQLGLLLIRKDRESIPKARTLRITPSVREVIKSILPFHPTDAQKRVLKEIVDDLCSPRVMSRLLQGDVGSGKTIVALQAIVLVLENGYQAALMVPTEILAEQHLQTLGRYLSGTRYRLGFLARSQRKKAKTNLLQGVRSGEIDLLVGTHALIEKDVEFKNLALAVIDEQHRFGVLQRHRLMEKGDAPDTLVMTATPIPRSLALTVYGDLAISVLDELPPGRQPVRTVVKNEKNRHEVYGLLRQQLGRGRQAYVVYPLVEESEKVDLLAATEMAEHLQKEVFPQYRVGLMHGRLKGEEKEALMQDFKEGRIHLLVSTSVIEVGIDIPNATAMIVEHAERFGLSQLHQLRGRIGRGPHPSVCVLMTAGVGSREAYQRLDVMRKTDDGFKIAEKDLEIRGPGEFVGTRQSGLPEFRFANLVRDRKLLELARLEAEKHLNQTLARPAEERPGWRAETLGLWKKRFGLYQVG